MIRMAPDGNHFATALTSATDWGTCPRSRLQRGAAAPREPRWGAPRLEQRRALRSPARGCIIGCGIIVVNSCLTSISDKMGNLVPAPHAK